MQPVINELIKFSIRQSPHRRIKFESAWEKQHLAWVKKHLSKQLLMVEAERLIQLGESDIPTLRGWFLKVSCACTSAFLFTQTNHVHDG
jgi:hypothetical protein